MAGDDVAGLSELGKLLDKLPATIQQSVLQGAVYEAAQAILPAMQQAAPVLSGRLHDSIVAVKENAVRRRKAGRFGSMVSAGIAFTKPGRRYWHLSEFGTVKQPARPWIRPTFAARSTAVLTVLKKNVGKRIEREARRLAKETGAKK